MENQSASVHSLFEKAGDYLETRVDLFKLEAVNKTSEIISTLVSKVVIIVVLVMFIIMLNIGVAMWIGSLMENSYAGFFIVAGFYGLVAIIVFATREKILKTPISNQLIKKMLN